MNNGNTPPPTQIKALLILALCNDGKVYKVPLKREHEHKTAMLLKRLHGGLILTETEPFINEPPPPQEESRIIAP